jgi:hypothetical protein
VIVTVSPAAGTELDAVTRYLAAGTGTVIAAVPVFPSLDAVIVALPAATAVTTPADDTVATAAFDVLHVTVRPVSTAPAASLVTAVNACVPPTDTVAALGVTSTVATGTGTVIAAVPVFPSLDAVIVALPAVTAVTTPADDTVATAAFDVLHVTVRPVSTAPAASLVTAVNACVPPTDTVAALGVTSTAATGDATCTPTVAERPPLDPVIVAVPALIALTRPVASTLATVGLLELHMNEGQPATVTPAASNGSPTSWKNRPGASGPAGPVDNSKALTEGVDVTAVLIRTADTERPTVNRATCWASMMLIDPSPVASPRHAKADGRVTDNPTVDRAICWASMMLTTSSSVTSPQRPGMAIHTSRPRVCMAESRLVLA